MRIHRLNEVMNSLRRAGGAIRAEDLAQTHGVSMRSIYRDIETLRDMGARIDGAAGLGYTLTEDHSLRPQNYTMDEVEALMLGLREVQELGDRPLADAALSAAAKLKASLTADLAQNMEHCVVHARRFRDRPAVTIDTGTLRRAARSEVKVIIEYQTPNGTKSVRTIWPLGIVSMDNALVVLGWCELRQDNRAFRLDRIMSLDVTTDSFRPHRVSKLRVFIAKMQAEKQSGMFFAGPNRDRSL
ncbi:MAG: helix-turn-helix transcriptional regulator [Planktomarina sp.]